MPRRTKTRQQRGGSYNRPSEYFGVNSGQYVDATDPALSPRAHDPTMARAVTPVRGNASTSVTGIQTGGSRKRRSRRRVASRKARRTSSSRGRGGRGRRSRRNARGGGRGHKMRGGSKSPEEERIYLTRDQKNRFKSQFDERVITTIDDIQHMITEESDIVKKGLSLLNTFVNPNPKEIDAQSEKLQKLRHLVATFKKEGLKTQEEAEAEAQAEAEAEAQAQAKANRLIIQPYQVCCDLETEYSDSTLQKCLGKTQQEIYNKVEDAIREKRL